MMQNEDRFQTAAALQHLCALADVDVSRVLRRARMPSDFLSQTMRSPTPQQYFAVWEAVCAESKKSDLSLVLGRAFATDPFNSGVFAFSQSANVLAGLQRLALFKPLASPCRFDVVEQHNEVCITIGATQRHLSLPRTMHALEVIYILENIRYYTEEHIIPLSIQMPCPDLISPQEAAYFGIMPHRADRLRLTISLKDATRRLLTKNEDCWSWTGTHVKQKAQEPSHAGTTKARVQGALIELLPAGIAALSHVASHLHLSQRTLQRHLAEEGTSYQAVLDKIRCDLALQYLRHGITVDEISYLLAYSAPNNFYRAFHNWTGMTPRQARQSAG